MTPEQAEAILAELQRVNEQLSTLVGLVVLLD